MKVFIPLLPTLMKDTISPQLQISALKAFGIFALQASMVPLRMQNFFKDVVDQKIMQDICFILSTVGQVATPLQKVAIHALSILICPIYGECYSFPWKRGPHDNLNEYLEALPTFDQLRAVAYQSLSEFDFLAKFVALYNSEDESQHQVTKVAVLRVLNQCLRLKKEVSDAFSEQILMHNPTMQLLTTVTYSKDSFIQACAIQIFGFLQKYLIGLKKDPA